MKSNYKIFGVLIIIIAIYSSCQKDSGERSEIPTARFSADKTNIIEGDTVYFTDESLGKPTSWVWDFGDENSSREQNPLHVYKLEGIYTVQLTVNNDQGGNYKIEKDYITVEKKINTQILFNSELTYNFVTDVDGNNYKTIQIESQIWMAENLKTTHFNDETAIPEVTNPSSWTNLSTPAYCWYNNDTVNKNIYGALYNGFTIETDKLCPNGWHVPTDDEWTTLTDNIGGENIAGGKLKEIGTNHWNEPNEGATNETGFTALPGGLLSTTDEECKNINEDGYWWTSTQNPQNFLLFRRGISTDLNSIYRTSVDKTTGYSVRCIKD